MVLRGSSAVQHGALDRFDDAQAAIRFSGDITQRRQGSAIGRDSGKVEEQAAVRVTIAPVEHVLPE